MDFWSSEPRSPQGHKYDQKSDLGGGVGWGEGGLDKRGKRGGSGGTALDTKIYGLADNAS